MNHDITRWVPLIRHQVNESVRAPLSGHLSREDLVQDTLLSVWRSLPSYTGRPDDLPVWVCAITRRRVADAYRRASVRPRTEPLDSALDHSAPDDVEQAAITSAAPIDTYLQGLARRQRQVLWLLAHDYSTRQIARVLGVSEVTVRAVVSRARPLLRPLLAAA